MSGTVDPVLIAGRIAEIESALPAGIELVAVSKFQPVDAVRAAWEAGQRRFGESRVQELLEKIPLLPDDINWHFIGHLQTNKVRQIIGKTSLIESVDSLRLLNLIEKESNASGVMTDVLLQVHVAAEETKFGFSRQELEDYFASGAFRELSNTRLCGLMAMATNTSEQSVVRRDFAEAADIFRNISQSYGEQLPQFRSLSMGMSGDWPTAVEEGATIIRIGSAIFGPRIY